MRRGVARGGWRAGPQPASVEAPVPEAPVPDPAPEHCTLLDADPHRNWLGQLHVDRSPRWQADFLASRREDDARAGAAADRGALGCAVAAADDSADDRTRGGTAADRRRVLFLRALSLANVGRRANPQALRVARRV